MNVIYSKRGNAVVIRQAFQRDIVVDARSLHQSIENIKERKADYASLKAYERHLEMFQGALAFLPEEIQTEK